jgi:hypothetical protein
LQAKLPITVAAEHLNVRRLAQRKAEEQKWVCCLV